LAIWGFIADLQSKLPRWVKSFPRALQFGFADGTQ